MHIHINIYFYRKDQLFLAFFIFPLFITEFCTLYTYTHIYTLYARARACVCNAHNSVLESQKMCIKKADFLCKNKNLYGCVYF